MGWDGMDYRAMDSGSEWGATHGIGEGRGEWMRL